VKQQVADVVALLQDAPHRVRAELMRLDVQFTLYPVREEGQCPYLRAVSEGAFEALVGSGEPFPATGLSLPNSNDEPNPEPRTPNENPEPGTWNSEPHAPAPALLRFTPCTPHPCIGLRGGADESTR
jgi:hypothetical protein